MKWKKLGKIFDPTDHKLSNNCVEFAQSPQALVFDDFIRVYFSTREKDQAGKYLSHISFVEFDKKFNKIIRISKDTVIPLGNLGCFDEHGIFPLNILKDKDTVLGYISGWSRRVSVSVETSIGLAISYDHGLTFKRIGEGPILSASLNEPFLVGDPFVRVYDGVYHMWYIYGSRWFSDSSKVVFGMFDTYEKALNEMQLGFEKLYPGFNADIYENGANQWISDRFEFGVMISELPINVFDEV